jgi:hypothetical protein
MRKRVRKHKTKGGIEFMITDRRDSQNRGFPNQSLLRGAKGRPEGQTLA